MRLPTIFGKVGALDRNEAWGNAVDKLLTRCVKCAARRSKRCAKQACTGVYDMSGIHESHRHLRKAVSPAGVLIVFSAKCGGANRLKRLSEGKHPYKAYSYLIQVLWSVGINLATFQQVQAPVVCSGAVTTEGIQGTIFGQPASEQDGLESLTLFRYQKILRLT